MKWFLLTLAGLVALVALATLIGLLLPREHTATRAATFRLPPSQVFAVVRDFAALPTWRTELTAVELLPPAGGSPRYREISRHGPVTYVVREERVGERLVTEIADDHLPYGGRWVFELRATPTGTELRITEQAFVKNPLFRFLARFVFGHATTLENYLRALAKKTGDAPPSFN